MDDQRNRVAEAFEETIEGRRFRWEFVVVAVGVFYILAHVLVWW